MADDHPFASQAQQTKWVELLQQGKVSQASYDARAKASEGIDLPLRAPARQRTVGPSRAPAQAKLGKLRY